MSMSSSARGGPFRLPPGAWTDDTSMALCLAESLIECGGFDAADQMRRYVRWYHEGCMSSTDRCFDIGNTTRAALQRFENTGDPWCGSNHPCTAGNGSIMRLAPVVLAFATSPSEAIAMAARSSRTTHGARDAVDGCRYLAALLLGALGGASKEGLAGRPLRTAGAPVGARATGRRSPRWPRARSAVATRQPSAGPATWCARSKRRICARNISALRGDTRRAFTEIQRGDWRRRCERRHRCPKLDGLSSPCLSSPKGSTVPVVSPIPPFATTGTVPFIALDLLGATRRASQAGVLALPPPFLAPDCPRRRRCGRPRAPSN